jgi:hypothetical protein
MPRDGTECRVLMSTIKNSIFTIWNTTIFILYCLSNNIAYEPMCFTFKFHFQFQQPWQWLHACAQRSNKSFVWVKNVMMNYQWSTLLMIFLHISTMSSRCKISSLSRKTNQNVICADLFPVDFRPSADPGTSAVTRLVATDTPSWHTIIWREDGGGGSHRTQIENNPQH